VWTAVEGVAGVVDVGDTLDTPVLLLTARITALLDGVREGVAEGETAGVEAGLLEAKTVDA